MLHHKFVEFIPDSLDEGVLYISVDYCTAIHKCVCGCGNKVVTPISPTAWQLSFNGVSVSLKPSIGNWNFDCQSHYWIENNKIRHAGRWSTSEIQEGRDRDMELKNKYHSVDERPAANASNPVPKMKKSLWESVLQFLGLVK